MNEVQRKAIADQLNKMMDQIEARGKTATITAPDGRQFVIDPAQVDAVRADIVKAFGGVA